jgi:hypothetical protein
MKLRIQGNSLRFRLSQSEVAALAFQGRVQESVQISPAASDLFIYSLETSPECKEVRAWHSDCRIGITLPDQLVQSWAATDQVGIEQIQPVGAGTYLRITVEKDFDCQHAATHPSTGPNFPRPR